MINTILGPRKTTPEVIKLLGENPIGLSKEVLQCITRMLKTDVPSEIFKNERLVYETLSFASKNKVTRVINVCVDIISRAIVRSKTLEIVL